MKKLIISLFLLMSLLFVSGCFTAKDKTFEKEGIKVTLTTDFQEGEHILAKLFISSKNAVFMANYESKSLLSSYGYRNLSAKGYLELVLQVNNKTAKGEIKTYEDDNTSFAYAYYDATVDGTDFSYMIVTLVGENRYYAINFYSKAEKFDSLKDDFMKYAKTIRVE